MSTGGDTLSYTDFVEWENELALVDETLATLGVPQDAPPASFYDQTLVPAPAQTAWVPIPDNPVTYTGPGTQPTWENVFTWYATTTHAQTPDLQTTAPTVGVQVQRAIDVANGQTIKALSGFINNAVNTEIWDSAVLAQRITDVENVLGADSHNKDAAIAQVKQELDLVVNGALPQLWSAITKLNAAIPVEGRGVLTLAEVWTTDNIFKPLEAQIKALKVEVTAQPQAILAKVPSIIDQVVPTLGLASAATVAGLATSVGTLLAEDASCVKPMCATMGPGSALGKLLKALSVVADAALLAELLSMTEPQLVALLTSVIGHFAGLVGDFESYFTSGTETLGGLITGAIGSAL